ncbi:MAG: DUF4178 domain-containing protein [Candidatus Uhrbacteria bacterium]|nr:DUF4178 domain-containing protein [Candidatus Uhrbacteria bacterium]
MNIQEALENLKNDEAIIVSGKTFQPEKVDELKLETGEVVYWVRDGEALWLSVDAESEEVVLFDDVVVEMDMEDDAVFYNNQDFETSYEGVATILDDSGDSEKVSFKDYESSDGSILRVMFFEVTGETSVAVGRVIPEEELQEV